MARGIRLFLQRLSGASVAAFGLCLLFASGNALADVPWTLTEQGRLLDSSGAPVTGNTDLTFTIYDSQTGGAILWSGDVTAKLDGSGFYTVTLGGQSNPINPSVLKDGKAWIGVKVNGGTELAPRMALNSAPYAVVAGQAESVKDGSITTASLAPNFSVSAGQVAGVSWSNIVNIPANVANGDTLTNLSCTTGQVAQFNGTKWACADQKAYTGADFATSNQTCASGKVANGIDANGKLGCTPMPTYTGANFATSNQSCGSGKVATGVNGSGKLTCATDKVNTYTAGNGLTLSSNKFAVNTATLDQRYAMHQSGGWFIEAEGYLGPAGVAKTDATASAGKDVFAAASSGKSGRVWGVQERTLGSPLGIGPTRVTMRVKVTNNTGTSRLAYLDCMALRGNKWVTLGAANIVPSEFSGKSTWREYSITCAFRPDDPDQFIGVDGFVTGNTDLFVDYARTQPITQGAATFHSVPVYVRGTGLNHSASRVVQIGNTIIPVDNTRGFNLTVLDRHDLHLVFQHSYDEYGTPTDRTAMDTEMNKLNRDEIVIITSFDAWEGGLTANLVNDLVSCGASRARLNTYNNASSIRHPFVLIGIPGMGDGNAINLIYSNASSAPYAEVSTNFVWNPYTGEYTPSGLP